MLFATQLLDRRAPTEPSATYTTPAALAADERLGLEERIRMLQRWAFDISARADAAAEGMTAPPPKPGRPQITLRDVRQALDSLAARRSSSEDERRDMPVDRIPLASGSGRVVRDTRRSLPATGLLAGIGALVIFVTLALGAPVLAGVATGVLALGLLTAAHWRRGRRT